ncbi:MAG: FAD-binding oxidoreductase [Rhodobacterales bacterium]|nr:FAD-binding oxidoreductase [Rhodobacterales bacterium]
MTKNANQIVVIGAGIVGVSTAIWLRRAGRDVILVDKGAVGMGTSYGNGGILAACGVAPVTAPGLGAKGPKLLLDPNFPLFLRWSYLPKLLPWLMKYLSHANEPDTRRISKGLAGIVADSVEQHKSLVNGTSAEGWITDSDYCFAYKDQTAFAGDALTFELRQQAGFVPEIIKGGAVHDYEPALGPDIGLLAVMKDHGYIRNPAGYVQALAQVLVAEGGEIRQAEVIDIDLTDGKISAVITDQGRIDCAGAVLATGVWSKPLAKKLGLNVPLESERGYHVVFKDPSIHLNATYMIASGKFVATPMDAGLRCAGIVEFGGLTAGPSKAPLAFLHKHVKLNFPTLKYSGVEEWHGHRPAPTDSLPLIGEIAGSGVFAGFGHHHIGLTGGPKTGRLIADLITQKGTNIDLSAYDPGRFA